MIECEESSVGAGERGTEHGKNNSNGEKKTWRGESMLRWAAFISHVVLSAASIFFLGCCCLLTFFSRGFSAMGPNSTYGTQLACLAF